MKTNTTTTIKKGQSKQELINRLVNRNLNSNNISMMNCVICEGTGGN